MSNVRLIVFRHAPAATEGICYGRGDMPVSLPHEESGARIFKALADRRVDHLWSSPTSRCQGPARVLAGLLGTHLRIAPEIREMDFGSWEGRGWSEIENTDATTFREWGRDWVNRPAPGGESASDLEVRIRAWLLGLEPGLHVAVVHGGTVQAMRVIVAGATWAAAMGEPVGHLVPHEFWP
jgi:alpha-ribazole phosphatase